MRVFLDAALVIYLVEQNPVFGPRVEAWLIANPCDLVSTELVRMESLILPVRSNDSARVTEFEDFFALQVSEIVNLSRAVFDQAVKIRALYSFKAPDSLHLAAAVEAGCDVFLTNDQKLTRFTGIRVEVI